MASKRLTVSRIKAAQPSAERYVLWDSDIRGFGVKVFPGGAKTWILKYRLASGLVRWATLERVGVLTLPEARKRARTMLGSVSSGDDPLAWKDHARTAITLGDVADRWLTDHIEPNRKPHTARDYRTALALHIRPLLGKRPIADVGLDDAQRLHHRLRKTPVAANRALACLSSLLTWSARTKYRPLGPNPCDGVPRFPEKTRKVYLSDADYPKVGRALRSADIGKMARTAIELLLLTGARPSEITTLQWSHVDLRRGVLNLPDSKTGAKVIYLPPQAVAVLKRWHRFTSPYVFPAQRRGVQSKDKPKGKDHMHAQTLTHAWAAIREAAKLDAGVRLYDAARHSFASMAISQHGLSLVQVGQQLGHSQVQTTSRYAHLHDDAAQANAALVGGSIAAALKRKVRA